LIIFTACVQFTFVAQMAFTTFSVIVVERSIRPAPMYGTTQSEG
jgi:hypothetical protein